MQQRGGDLGKNMGCQRGTHVWQIQSHSLAPRSSSGQQQKQCYIVDTKLNGLPGVFIMNCRLHTSKAMVLQMLLCPATAPTWSLLAAWPAAPIKAPFTSLWLPGCWCCRCCHCCIYALPAPLFSLPLTPLFASLSVPHPPCPASPCPALPLSQRPTPYTPYRTSWRPTLTWSTARLT